MHSIVIDVDVNFVQPGRNCVKSGECLHHFVFDETLHKSFTVFVSPMLTEKAGVRFSKLVKVS